MAKRKKKPASDWRQVRKEIIDDMAYGVFPYGIRDYAVAVYPANQVLRALEHAAQLGSAYQCSSCSISVPVHEGVKV